MTHSVLTRTVTVALAATVLATTFNSSAEARWYRYGYGDRGGAIAAGAIIGAAAGLAIAGAASRNRYYYGDPYYYGDGGYDGGVYAPAYYGRRVYVAPRYSAPPAYYDEGPVVVYRQPRVRYYEREPVHPNGGNYHFQKWYETDDGW
ncbi:MAG: hypothetical protein HC900_09870 [Methylacidiphilales bacterium]|nr:hypothetical protein [Candidatus Methylacidiphilales bacterium]